MQLLYNKVLTLNPNKASTYNNLGVIKDQGKIDKAIEVYKMALKISLKTIMYIVTWLCFTRIRQNR